MLNKSLRVLRDILQDQEEADQLLHHMSPTTYTSKDLKITTEQSTILMHYL